jgi:hypothetical protein
MSCIFDVKAIRFDESIHPDKQTRDQWLEKNHFKTRYSNQKGELKPDEGFYTYKQKNIKNITDFCQHEVEKGIFAVSAFRGIKTKQTRAKRPKK